MEQSRTLVTAQINFLDDRLSLIHVPLKSYSTYVQPILQLLYPKADTATVGTNGHSHADEERPNGHSTEGPWTSIHSFLNISVTPIECSIICSKALADRYFAPLVARTLKADRATISPEDFVAVAVEGEGLEAGQRVLELTSPLAMAGISIFFFTTYFSDYILVPIKSRTAVIHALEERGFVFSASSHAYVNVSASHGRNTSSSSLSQALEPPSTPPPSSVSELQARTFSLLSRRKILPQVHRNHKLLHLAGRSNHSDLNEFQIGVTRCLVHPPQVFSLTLTEFEDPSLLIESEALHLFGPNHNTILLGAKDDYLIPITLDLDPLPLEATGIVCGLSGRLVGGGAGTGRVMDPVEMKYLSTARGAAVIIDEADLERAIELLAKGEGGLDVSEPEQ